MLFPQTRIIVILGPTASGKSDLAVRLAKKIKGEIISADSRQVYRELNIGTGKITQAEMKRVPHHLLSIADPKKKFSVTEFQKLGKKAIKNIINRGNTPIIVGGTGLYIDALIYNYSLPPVKPNTALRKKLEILSTEDLFSQLKAKDPDRAKNIDYRNRRRLIRALEILEKQPIPKKETALLKKSPYELIKLGIAMEQENLRKRIHTRLIKRISQGMIGEVRDLLTNNKITHNRLEELGLEYRYISRYLRRLINKEQMISQLESEIWKYAKRQMTWFRKDKEIIWIKPDINISHLIDTIET